MIYAYGKKVVDIDVVEAKMAIRVDNKGKPFQQFVPAHCSVLFDQASFRHDVPFGAVSWMAN